jgi:Cdc6-like AAA superfamily ATPase
MVGREEQLKTIEAAYDAPADQPTAGGAVLYGEAGVGKTRLAREATTRLARRGSPTEAPSPSMSGLRGV